MRTSAECRATTLVAGATEAELGTAVSAGTGTDSKLATFSLPLRLRPTFLGSGHTITLQANPLEPHNTAMGRRGHRFKRGAVSITRRRKLSKRAIPRAKLPQQSTSIRQR